MTRPARNSRAALMLVLMLVVGSVGPAPAAAVSFTSRLTAEGSVSTTRTSGWAIDARVDEHPADRPMVIRGFVPVWRVEARDAALETIAAVRAVEAEARAATTAAAAVGQAAAKATAKATAPAAPAYVGENHLWIPSLGLSRSVSAFSCSRSTPPANVVYRWGCAGLNNVYLFGHAWGVMKPLHDGYEAGKVKVGMVAKYADAKGKVWTFRVTEIRVVTPDQADWAIAAQATLSMTLQTCLGANSNHRLLVRLVADN